MSGPAHVVALALASVAAALAVACAVGVVAMRDAFQKLQFLAPPATLSPALLAVAIALETHSAQAALKTLLVAVLLTATNGVVGHATARAAFIRAHGRWPPSPDQLDDGAGPGGAR